MIKQYVLTIEASDIELIDTFVNMLNAQAEATKDISHIVIHVEKVK